MRVEKIALVTDSTCDVSPVQLEELGVFCVPLSIAFGEREYLDGEELSPDLFYELLAKAPALPTTSQPPVGKFLDLFTRLQAEGYTHILGLFISRKFSGTCQAAATAAGMLAGVTIKILDSKLTTWGLAHLLFAAQRLLLENASFETLLAKLEKWIARSRILFTVETLDALQRGGRIGGARAFLGKMFGVRPLLSMSGAVGSIEAIGTFYSRRAVAETMAQLAAKHVQEQGLFYGMTLIYTVSTEPVEELKTALQNAGVDMASVHQGRIGSVVGSHLGKDGWGLVLG